MAYKNKIQVYWKLTMCSAHCSNPPAVTNTENSDSTTTLHMPSMSVSRASDLFRAENKDKYIYNKEESGIKWNTLEGEKTWDVED